MERDDIKKNVKNEPECPKKEEVRPLLIKRIRVLASLKVGHGAFTGND